MSEKIEFKTYGELLKDLEGTPQPSEARCLINSAMYILEGIESWELPKYRIASVTWRLADALKRIGVDYPQEHKPGIDEPTGLGAKLETNR